MTIQQYTAGAILASIVALVNVADATGSLRRKRNAFAVPADATIERDEFMMKEELTLDNLWSRAIDNNLDQDALLAERFLQDRMSMSMTRGPTPAPATRGPTPAPTTGAPTPAPITAAPTTAAPNTAAPTTAAPSFGDCLAGSTRTAFLRNQLSAITAETLLDNAATPQGMAFQWITEEDPLMFDPCTFPSTTQRYGLATFYYSTQGAMWTRDDGWLGGTTECEWLGVTCDTANTTVTRLQLRKYHRVDKNWPEAHYIATGRFEFNSYTSFLIPMVDRQSLTQFV